MKKRYRFDRCVGTWVTYNGISSAIGLCAKKLEELFEIPRKIKYIWLTISTRKMKESYCARVFDSQLRIAGKDISMPITMIEELLQLNIKRFYVKVEYEE